MLLTTCYGYYQPAGPLISTHHHHHSSSSSSVINTGKAPAVLSTLEASPTPTPPPPPSSVTSHGTAPPPQIVSATSTSSGNTRGGDESSDNDVIITAATSCGEVAPVAPPAPQPLTLQQQPPPAAASHHAYRYPQSYPPPPTPSTPQHIHHQSYTYNYPHTQYYPSPPASASIQYSAVAANPQHHHYHNQDLCYSGATSNYPPASYYHHKSYSTPPPPPPPPSYHRRYVAPPPPHHSQYYPPELYSSSAVANPGGQQNPQQNPQQSQQMVATASSGSVSSYQPPPVGVSNAGNHPPPTMVETYPPPPMVDPYPPPPTAYYTSYSAGPGAPGCYSHSPPTRGLAFIDATYQSCPCPMQSCPKNVHTGPLTGDGKGPHLSNSKQQQDSFHHIPPLPPVALALPLEPPGAMGPPSPARGSAGMPPPPSPATASASAGSEPDTKRAYPVEEEDGMQTLLTKPEITILPAMVDMFTDGSGLQQGLLAISKVNNSSVCDKISKKKSRSTMAVQPLKMDNIITNNLIERDRDVNQQKRQGVESVQLMEYSLLDAKTEKDVKLEASNTEEGEEEEEEGEEEVEEVEEGEEEEVVITGHKSFQPQLISRDITVPNCLSQKRRLSSSIEGTSKSEVAPVQKRRRSSPSVGATFMGQDSDKDQNEVCEELHQLQEVLSSQTVTNNYKTGPKCQPLSGNSCSVHNAKQNTKKRKLDDTIDLTGNKEPKLSIPPVKRIATSKVGRVRNSDGKIYPSRGKQTKNNSKVNRKLTASEALDSILFENRTICDSLNAMKNGLTLPQSKKLLNGRFGMKRVEEKLNGSVYHESKKVLKQQSKLPNLNMCTNGLVLRVGQSNISKVSAEAGKAHRRKQPTDTQVGGRQSVKKNHILRRNGLREPSPDQMIEEEVESILSRSLSLAHTSQPLTVRRASICSRKEQTKKLPVTKGTYAPGSNSVPCPQQISKKQLQPVANVAVQDPALSAWPIRRASLKKSLPLPRWSNGWSFEGEPFQAKVFLTSDDPAMGRKCYPAMRHTEGDVIHPRDCVLLKSGPRKVDLPFVAKVAALWENPDDGEMMVSLLWYYRPEHTEHGRRPEDMEDEIFASKHKDINSVACIEDKCYVLTFNEYCRYRKCVRRLEDGVREPGLVVPQHDGYPRRGRQPPGCVAPDMVFFCRRVYDFRQRRILKNPG